MRKKKHNTRPDHRQARQITAQLRRIDHSQKLWLQGGTTTAKHFATVNEAQAIIAQLQNG